MAKNYKTVPNQKIVRTVDIAGDGQFFKTNKEQFREAAKLFTKKFTAILYLELTGNQLGYEQALSSAFMMDTYGISRNGYDAAVAELIELKFLVQEAEGSNVYLMYRTPQVEEEIIPVALKKSNVVALKKCNALHLKSTTGCTKKEQEIDNTNIIDNNTDTFRTVVNDASSLQKSLREVEDKPPFIF